MEVKQIIIREQIVVEKFQGKGGWTYIRMPKYVKSHPNRAFGWRTVDGSIDHYVITNIKLLPFGDGTLFLPLKASIRKIIDKEVGAMVNVNLVVDQDDTIRNASQIKASLDLHDTKLWNLFIKLPQFQQHIYSDRIANSKDEEQVNQLIRLIDDLTKLLSSKI